MGTRISVPKQELKAEQRELKEKQDLSLRDISSEIGTEFKNHLYKGFNFEPEHFYKLQKLYSGEIRHEKVDHRNGATYENRTPELKKSRKTAEFIGILLGDGNIRDFHEKSEGKHICNYRVKVILNREEKLMIKKVKRLFREITEKEPSIYKSKDSKATSIYVYSKDIVEDLKKLGLESGDKVENQIGVPKWIKEDEEFAKQCLRGLIDTDGTIYRRGRDGYKVV